MIIPLIPARRAVAETLTPENHRRCNCRAEIAAGEWDRGHKIRAARRAIELAETP